MKVMVGSTTASKDRGPISDFTTTVLDPDGSVRALLPPTLYDPNELYSPGTAEQKSDDGNPLG